MSRPRTTSLFAALGAAALLVSGCGGSGSTEGPAPSEAEPVVLALATNDGPDTPAGEFVTAFANHVDQVSEGTIRIEAAWEAAGPDPDDWDQAVARTVINGENAMGFIPARAFDALGVGSLQALQTPFLLTTSDRVEAVVRSDLVDDLMAGLEDVGLTGLALFPDDLRRLFSYSTPFTAPDDLAGVTIRAPYSQMTDAILATVGARTVDVSGAGWEADIASGKVAGSESSLAFLAALGDQSRTMTSTTGVLFPKVNALVVNEDLFGALSDQQRGMLREAAIRTREHMDWLSEEAESAKAFCAAGGRIRKAEDADLAALREAMAGFAPPQAAQETRELASAIGELVADLPEEKVEPCGP